MKPVGSLYSTYHACHVRPHACVEPSSPLLLAHEDQRLPHARVLEHSISGLQDSKENKRRQRRVKPQDKISVRRFSFIVDWLLSYHINSIITLKHLERRPTSFLIDGMLKKKKKKKIQRKREKERDKRRKNRRWTNGTVECKALILLPIQERMAKAQKKARNSKFSTKHDPLWQTTWKTLHSGIMGVCGQEKKKHKKIK